MSSSNREFRLTVRLSAVLLGFLFSLLLMEGGARMVFAFKDEIKFAPVISDILRSSLILDPYEMPSPRGGYHWVLRPGYSATVAELAADKEKAGRTVGAKALESDPATWEGRSEEIFRVNQDGFKGPEIDRFHSRVRILALGDSVTFGLGAVSYPRIIEGLLNSGGEIAEVINGGVEGYFPANILYEIDRYKDLEPEIVILYIGWNPLYSDPPWADALENRFRLIWLVKKAFLLLTTLSMDNKTYALEMYQRDLRPDRDDRDLDDLETYTPPFMGEIVRIVEEFKSVDSRVVLVTLPGLFTTFEDPSEKALRIGHLPMFTDNPFVLARITESYNSELRALAQRRGLALIDLEEWSEAALQPRDAFFTDSVHLTPKGLRTVGTFMAGRLASLIDQIE